MADITITAPITIDADYIANCLASLDPDYSSWLHSSWFVGKGANFDMEAKLIDDKFEMLLLVDDPAGGENAGAWPAYKLGLKSFEADGVDADHPVLQRFGVEIDAPDEDEEEDSVDEIDGRLYVAIDRTDLVNGLVCLAKNYPAHFADLLSDNNDANTGDLLMQCILFGEEVFA